MYGLPVCTLQLFMKLTDRSLIQYAKVGEWYADWFVLSLFDESAVRGIYIKYHSNIILIIN